MQINNSSYSMPKQNINFKANFKFSKAAAQQFNSEMYTLIGKNPIKSLRGQNRLQILVNKIKAMYPEETIKLDLSKSKYLGTSYLTGRGVHSACYWFGESRIGNRAFTSGYHTSEEGYIESSTPIEDILREICKNPKKFFEK